MPFHIAMNAVSHIRTTKGDALRMVPRPLADNGLAVVFISAELEEVLRISNRVAILRERR